jgi:periplasmic divalent cation tolerance protein
MAIEGLVSLSAKVKPMSIWFVYITTPNREDALAIGQALIEDRLAACVNVLDGMRSIYRWEGKIEHGQEAILIAKTKEPLVGTLIERVKALHGYSCPCIVAWPIEKGNAPFLDWIEKETR